MLILNRLNKHIKKIIFCRCDSFYVVNRCLTETKWLKHKMANMKLPPHRKDPVIKVLDTPEFKSIFTPELNKLASIFKSNNYELRIAGGAVRDFLIGLYPKDLDFATNATPNQMIKMFEQENIRMINLNGTKHGTVTARINDKENFEITTLRIDIVTNGRHAEVEFTTDWLLDASRRDLTINSMFLDLDGKIYDYFYGHDDLINKKVAFVGDPAQRICEDFLRILRYFRFYGRISDIPENHDEQTINAIKDNVNGLEMISGERIWSEWSKILQGNLNKELTKKIVECGCSKYIGLPKNINMESFDKVCTDARKNNLTLQPISLVTAMLNNTDEALDLHMRLRTTKYDRDLSIFIVTNRDISSENLLKHYQRIVLLTIYKVSVAREYVSELCKYKGNLKVLEEFEQWDEHFPINGYMVKSLLKEGCDHKCVGEVIKKLKEIWLDSNCNMSTAELESYIPQIAEEAIVNMQNKRNRNEKLRSNKKKK